MNRKKLDELMIKNYGIPSAEPKLFNNTFVKSVGILTKKNNEFKIIKTERYHNKKKGGHSPLR